MLLRIGRTSLLFFPPFDSLLGSVFFLRPFPERFFPPCGFQDTFVLWAFSFLSTRTIPECWRFLLVLPGCPRWFVGFGPSHVPTTFLLDHFFLILHSVLPSHGACLPFPSRFTLGLRVVSLLGEFSFLSYLLPSGGPFSSSVFRCTSR